MLPITFVYDTSTTIGEVVVVIVHPILNDDAVIDDRIGLPRIPNGGCVDTVGVGSCLDWRPIGCQCTIGIRMRAGAVQGENRPRVPSKIRPWQAPMRQGRRIGWRTRARCAESGAVQVDFYSDRKVSLRILELKNRCIG